MFVKPSPTASHAPGVIAPLRRRGVTLMECIFAIGVVLTGLVGLAALIPIASQNARDTLEIDRSISESTSASAIGLVQSFHDLDSLVIYDKSVTGSILVPEIPRTIAGSLRYFGSYRPTRSPQTVQAKLDQIVSIGGVPTPVQKLESPGYFHMEINTGLSGGLCIDPLGMADLALMNSASSFVDNPNSNPSFRAPETTDTAFDYSRFPYFSERYNVLSPPNDQIGGIPGPNMATLSNRWPMSPRMYRATLKSPLYDANPVTTGMFRFQLISPVASRGIFSSNSTLSGVESPDKESPRSLLTDTTLINSRLVDGGRDGADDYTWFATLVPNFLGGDSFRESVVVVRRRLPPVPRRIDDPLALRRTNYMVDDGDDNPSAERLTWIDPTTAIGFSGGSGGEVTVYGSRAVNDQIDSNSWVMLSRQPHEVRSGPILAPTGPAVHRWYRVISVSEAEEIDAYTWPGGTHNVWARRLSLAGSDWAFQDETSGNTSPVDDTFCTIVEGAVSVIESEVKFE